MKPSLALDIHREAIREIVSRHRGRNPRVFGSAARGEDQEGSDLDLLVDPAPGMTLLDVGAIMAESEKLLGVRVDVMLAGPMPARMAREVSEDMRRV